MFKHSRANLAKFATLSSLVVLSAFGSPASAGELIENLGPVGPNEPILTTVGNQRVIAFYVSSGESCALHAVVWDQADTETDRSVARVRVSLQPGQIVHIDSPKNESLNLLCGSKAESLAAVDQDELSTYGITTKSQAITANASGF